MHVRDLNIYGRQLDSTGEYEYKPAHDDLDIRMTCF
jgi:hypothetical protein